MPNPFPQPFKVCVSELNGSTRIGLIRQEITPGTAICLDAAGARWEFSLDCAPTGSDTSDISDISDTSDAPPVRPV